MKNIYWAIAAATLCLLLFLFLPTQSGDGNDHDPWFGYCKISDNYPQVGLISVGEDVFYDRNSDSIPQQSELVPRLGSLEINSLDGGSTATLKKIASGLVPKALSDSRPQLIFLEIQSNEFAELWQSGTIVTSRDPESAGTCHLLGPLSFILQSPDVELKPGKETLLRILIGTMQTDSSAISPQVGPSQAIVGASARDDPSQYAFDTKLRPTMEVTFSSPATESKVVELDGFC